jgi:hypothetical protein
MNALFEGVAGLQRPSIQKHFAHASSMQRLLELDQEFGRIMVVATV